MGSTYWALGLGLGQVLVSLLLRVLAGGFTGGGWRKGREGHWKACCVAVCCIGKRASRRYRYVDVSTLSHVVVVYSSRCYLWLSVHGWVSEHNATCCDTQTDTQCSAVCVRLSICCWLAQYIYDLRLHTALQLLLLLLLLPSLPITSCTRSSQAATSLFEFLDSSWRQLLTSVVLIGSFSLRWAAWYS